MSKFKWLYGKANLKKQNSKIKFLAQASSLDISKLDLVNKLCKECITNRSSKNKDFTTSSWVSGFVGLSNLFDNYVLLHNRSNASSAHGFYKKIKLNETKFDNSLPTEKKSHYEDIENFLELFTKLLFRAGYTEVPEDCVKQALQNTENENAQIELTVDSESYKVLKYWVCGRKVVNTDKGISLDKPLISNKPSNLHQKMIVASCNEKDNQFKLVSYQNVPENNYKFVLAENKVEIPLTKEVQVYTFKLISGFLLILNMGTFLMDHASLSLFLLPLSLTVITLQTVRFQTKNKAQFARGYLQWKSKLLELHQSRDEALLQEIISTADDKDVIKLILVYSIAWMKKNKGEHPIDYRSVNSECLSWLYRNLPGNMAATPHDYFDVIETMKSLVRLGLFRVGEGQDLQEGEIEVLPIEACREIMTSRLMEAADDVRGYDADVVRLQRDIYDEDS